MLRCVLYDADGGEYLLPAPLSLTVEMDENVPADSLYAVFPYAEYGELCRISVYRDDTLVFSGVVDEEERIESGAGRNLCISARSPAALLLDNEAAPCGYDHPSAMLMYERYARDFGIRLSESDDAVYFGEQDVLKGASCWSVLRSFCTACYSSAPRVSGTGVLYMKGLPHHGTLRFGNGAGEVRYTKLSECIRRCEEISEVYVKIENGGSYSLPIENRDAAQRGIRRRRYLNATLTESPMRCADAMIRNGRAKGYALKLRCPVCLLGHEGDAAVLSDSRFDGERGLYISAMRYHMSADGEYTDLTLKRRMTDVDQ